MTDQSASVPSRRETGNLPWKRDSEGFNYTVYPLRFTVNLWLLLILLAVSFCVSGVFHDINRNFKNTVTLGNAFR